MAQWGLPQLEDISIDTVERYQGSQRDVIIYSTGVQDQDGLDFLTANCFEEDAHTIDRKLNVAMTRARKQLIMIGNAGILRKNEIFSELITRYSV
jgi:superfamily I DNA and/or RNA helicase